MFRSLPLSLKTEVWDRIDTYLNEYAATHRDFNPNRSALVEEAVIFFLDAKDAEASGGSAEPESTDEMSMDLDMSSDDMSLDTEASTDEEPAMDEEAEPEAEPEAEEEPAEEEAPKPARRSSKSKAAKKSKKRK
jgi:hypothetical protein